MDTGVVADGVIGRAIGGRSRRRHGRDAVVGVNAVILQAFWQNSPDMAASWVSAMRDGAQNARLWKEA